VAGAVPPAVDTEAARSTPVPLYCLAALARSACEGLQNTLQIIYSPKQRAISRNIPESFLDYACSYVQAVKSTQQNLIKTLSTNDGEKIDIGRKLIIKGIRCQKLHI